MLSGQELADSGFWRSGTAVSAAVDAFVLDALLADGISRGTSNRWLLPPTTRVGRDRRQEPIRGIRRLGPSRANRLCPSGDGHSRLPAERDQPTAQASFRFWMADSSFFLLGLASADLLYASLRFIISF
jgi:hypothetical protein